MFSFFKSGKNKQENKPGALKSTYYVRENLIHNVNDLLKIINPTKPPKLVEGHTSEEIRFKGMLLNDLNEKGIISKMGSPIYIHDNGKYLEGHRVLFYKEQVEHYTFLVQFHFVDSQFFLVSNQISSTAMLSHKDKIKVINQLKRKYLDGAGLEEETYNLRITDIDKNIIFTSDVMYFYVNYLCNCSIKNKLLKRYSNTEIIEETDASFEDTLDKLF